MQNVVLNTMAGSKSADMGSRKTLHEKTGGTPKNTKTALASRRIEVQGSLKNQMNRLSKLYNNLQEVIYLLD